MIRKGKGRSWTNKGLEKTEESYKVFYMIIIILRQLTPRPRYITEREEGEVEGGDSQVAWDPRRPRAREAVLPHHLPSSPGTAPAIRHDSHVYLKSLSHTTTHSSNISTTSNRYQSS